jgi:hypothetical protein
LTPEDNQQRECEDVHIIVNLKKRVFKKEGTPVKCEGRRETEEIIN